MKVDLKSIILSAIWMGAALMDPTLSMDTNDFNEEEWRAIDKLASMRRSVIESKIKAEESLMQIESSSQESDISNLEDENGEFGNLVSAYKQAPNKIYKYGPIFIQADDFYRTTTDESLKAKSLLLIAEMQSKGHGTLINFKGADENLGIITRFSTDKDLVAIANQSRLDMRGGNQLNDALLIQHFHCYKQAY